MNAFSGVDGSIIERSWLEEKGLLHHSSQDCQPGPLQRASSRGTGVSDKILLTKGARYIYAARLNALVFVKINLSVIQTAEYDKCAPKIIHDGH